MEAQRNTERDGDSDGDSDIDLEENCTAQGISARAGGQMERGCARAIEKAHPCRRKT